MKSIVVLILPVFVLISSECISQPGNGPTKNTSRRPVPSGPHVVGVFDGRTPCQEIAYKMNISVKPACHKIKWRIILYQDPITQSPTTCEIKGLFSRTEDDKTKWMIQRGTPSNPDAVVFILGADDSNTLYFLKGDDNILLFLDRNKDLMVGNRDFGYTLNRIEN